MWFVDKLDLILYGPYIAPDLNMRKYVFLGNPLVSKWDMCPEGYDTILDISCEKCYNIISDWGPFTNYVDQNLPRFYRPPTPLMSTLTYAKALHIKSVTVSTLGSNYSVFLQEIVENTIVS